MLQYWQCYKTCKSVRFKSKNNLEMCFKVKLIFMHVSFLPWTKINSNILVLKQGGEQQWGSVPLIRHEVLYTDTQQERSGGFDNVAIPVAVGRKWRNRDSYHHLLLIRTQNTPPHTDGEHICCWYKREQRESAPGGSGNMSTHLGSRPTGNILSGRSLRPKVDPLLFLTPRWTSPIWS